MRKRETENPILHTKRSKDEDTSVNGENYM